MSVLSLLMLQNRESHPVANRKNGRGAPLTIGVTDATFYRWRQEYGGLKVDQVKRMKELEAENARLRRAVGPTP